VSDRYAHLAANNGFLRATFTLLGTADGGRKSGVFGDYRPNWSIGVADPSQQSGAPVVIDSVERIEPGAKAEVRLFPMWPEFWVGVEVGTELFAYEGARLVGTAVVTEVIPPTAKA
jgi:translation elongation factor EF-Tu-like GTPase